MIKVPIFSGISGFKTRQSLTDQGESALMTVMWPRIRRKDALVLSNLLENPAETRSHNNLLNN